MFEKNKVLLTQISASTSGWTLSEWTGAVGLQVESSINSLVEVDLVAAHPFTGLLVASSSVDVVADWASEGAESVTCDRLDVELDGAAVRAGVEDAAGLASASVGEEIRVADWSSDTSASNQQCRPIGVDALDVVSVTDSNATGWIAHRKQRTSRIESHDRVDLSQLRVLASVTSGVSAQAETDDFGCLPVEHVILVQIVEEGGNEDSDALDATSGTDVVDCRGALGPVDVENVEVVVIQELFRHVNVQVGGVVAEPAVNQDPQRAAWVEEA